MSIFDQRGQTVFQQYNAAGDINFGAVDNPINLLKVLEKLQDQFTLARKSGILPQEEGTYSEDQIKEAIEEAKKPDARKKTILLYLTGAKAAIENIATASNLITAVAGAIEVVRKLFP